MIKKVPHLEGLFCDQQGNVFSSRRNKNKLHKLKLKKSTDGYLYIEYKKAGKQTKYFSVHRVILLTWVGLPCDKKNICNHKNGNKHDNNLENLEWCSYQENNWHAVNVLNKNLRGEKHPLSKLTATKVREIKELRTRGCSQQKIANTFGVHRSVIRRILSNKSWSHVGPGDI